MRKQGTVVRWQAAKAFGFIRAGSGQDVFFHVRDFRSAAGAVPREGMKVSFEEVHVGGKGPRAMLVQPLEGVAAAPAAPRARPAPRRTAPARATWARPASGAWLALPLMLAYAATLGWAAWSKLLPWWIVPAALVLNLAAFFVYWQDKHAAETRRWRVPESTLHFWSLAGGWAGAWFAQQVLRHKSSKAAFLQVYRATVVVHCAGVAWWLYRGL